MWVFALPVVFRLRYNVLWGDVVSLTLCVWSDIDKIDDPVKKSAAISFIHNFGQMPKQVYIYMYLHEYMFMHMQSVS